VGMVRLTLTVDDVGPRSPHVRGDGPGIFTDAETWRAFSPRAWGWSAFRLRPAARTLVLPTCVGMVRREWGDIDSYRRSPHVRGDGPQLVARKMIEDSFSPRAWGWSGGGTAGEEQGFVLPTCVGMVRTCRGRDRTCWSSPHVRGDGPTGPCRGSAAAAFSPRAWGWSVKRPGPAATSAVLPTCVGMVRKDRWQRKLRTSSPHVRGDGPASSTSS